jgi:hypothetical protein
MVSCLQALQRGKWNTAALVTDTTIRTENSDPSGKRAGGYYDSNARVYRSRPRDGRDKAGNIETSKPYDKGQRVEDQEWRDLVTPDGYCNDILKETLGMSWTDPNTDTTT